MTRRVELQIEAGDLFLSSHPRRLRGLLLPFGETGRTNKGRLRVPGPDAVELPADPSVVTLNLDHKRNQPVGRAADLFLSDAGVMVDLDVAETPDGDALLSDVAEGKPGARNRLSAELTDLVIRAGELVSSRLFGAAAVEHGAFPSASILAADVGDDVDEDAVDDEHQADEDDDAAGAAAADDEHQADDVDDVDDPDDDPTDPDAGDVLAGAPTPNGDTRMTARTTVPTGGAPVRRRPPAPAQTEARGIDAIKTPGDLYAALAAAYSTHDDDLLAALNAVTSTANTPNVEQPAWVGKMWDGVAYERQYISLFNHADLTNWFVQGWKWGVKPTVAKYAGDVTDVPSNTPTTVPVQIEAERIAGAHKIDRKFRDFRNAEYLSAFYSAQTEAYAELSDVDTFAQVLDAAGPATPLGTLTGEAAAVPRALVAVVRGYFKVLRATRARPTFALLSDALYEPLLYTPADKVNPYLERLLGIQPGNLAADFLRPTVDLAADEVFVGVKQAVTVHEMGGGAPIRVQALDVAKGAEDDGVFGYTAVNVHDTRGLARISTATA